jgi:site-specific recombinase XerD
MKQNLPNRKQDLSKTKAQLFNQVPDAAHEFISLLVDTILALNYSSSTMRTYTSSFLKFLRDHQFRDPKQLHKEIIKYLASMMERGLSASSGHSMVNALLFYYQQIEQQKGFELKLPRPKSEKNYQLY